MPGYGDGYFAQQQQQNGTSNWPASAQASATPNGAHWPVMSGSNQAPQLQMQQQQPQSRQNQPQMQHQMPRVQQDLPQMQQHLPQMQQQLPQLQLQQQMQQQLPQLQQQMQPQQQQPQRQQPLTQQKQMQGQWQTQQQQSPAISQAQQRQQHQQQLGGISGSGAGLQSSWQMQLSNAGVPPSLQQPQHSLLSGNGSMPALNGNAVEGLRGSAALQGGFPGSTPDGLGSTQSGSAMSSLPQYYSSMQNSGGSAVSGVSGLEAGLMRSTPQSSSLSGAFPGTLSSLQSQAQILANYQRNQQQQHQLQNPAAGGSGDAWSSQRSATYAHPGIGGAMAGSVEVPNLAGAYSLAGLSAETQRAYLLQLQRQRTAAAAGQQGAASQQLLMQQQAAQAAQIQRATGSAAATQQRYHQSQPQFQRRMPLAPRRRKTATHGWDTGDETDSDDEADGEMAVNMQREDDDAGGIANQRPRRRAASAASQKFKDVYKQLGKEADLEDEASEGSRGGGSDASPAEDLPPKPRVTKPVVVLKSKAPVEEAAPSMYREDDSADDSELSETERRKAKLAAAAQAAAFVDMSEMDDEVERVLAHRDIEGIEPVGNDLWVTREFHIKWRRWSYIHTSWDTLSTLSQLAGYKRVTNYIKRCNEAEAARARMSREELELADVEKQMEEQLIEQHKLVERVFGHRREADNVQKVLVKWTGLPYAEATFELLDEVMANIDGGRAGVLEYKEREKRCEGPSLSVESQRRAFRAAGTRALEEQPKCLWSSGKLRDYQLDGLNWLVYSWSCNSNCILADEMGLGKTIQCVSLLGYLSEVQGVAGPFLVVVPLSTVPNWIKEFRRWLPQINAIVYVGDTKSREVIRHFEFKSTSALRSHKFEVVITTYELVLKDREHLGTINWAYLMVDEAHRLKNNESALYTELFQWNFQSKLLITGTPLQNSIKELWALLHFLEPLRFPSSTDFEAEYSLDNSEHVARLHTELRPHLLRRVIKDVEKSLPPKNERILRVDMTPLQKQFYKWILGRNFQELNKGHGNMKLLNIIMELKKCCNHPFLFPQAEEEYRGREGDVGAADRLVLTSGKMVLLDKLLRRLKDTGHRVLIFSQMVRALDIISDYMRLRGFQHQRLDGSTPAQARHQAMEHFNAPGSGDFAFLLSTRAGGLGINLATADTVIIFDSDWNPQNDLQAMSRAHRIGQSSTVNIYRLLTSGSVEEDILERAKQKMVLDHLVIQRMDTSGRTVLGQSAAMASGKQMFGKDEMAAILRFGAEALFKEDESEVATKSKAMYEDSIDAILARAEVVDEGAGTNEGADELLSAFNVATFKSAEDDKAFWNRLIPAGSGVTVEDTKPKDLGVRGARLKAMGAESPSQSLSQQLDGSESDADSPTGSDAYVAPSETKGKRKARSEAGSGVRGRKRSHMASPVPGGPVVGADVRMDSWPSATDADGRPLQEQTDKQRVIGRRDAGVFVRSVRRHGLQARLPAIAHEVGRVVAAAPEEALLGLWFGLLRGCDDAMAAAIASGKLPKEAVLDFYGVPVKAQEVRQFVDRMRLLADKIEELEDPASEFKMPEGSIPALPKWARACKWTLRDDAMLLLGVYRYGLDQWPTLAADADLDLSEKLAAAGEKPGTGGLRPDDDGSMLPRSTHLDTRAHGLLKKLDASSGAGRKAPSSTRARGRTARPTGSRTSRQRGIAAGRPVRGAGGGNGLEWENSDHLALSGVDGLGPGPKPTAAQHQAIMAEAWTEVQRLRSLQKQFPSMLPRDILRATRTCLIPIGDCVLEHVDNRGGDPTGKIEARLWAYLSKVTESSRNGAQLARQYLDLKALESQPDSCGGAKKRESSNEGDGDDAAPALPTKPAKASDAQASFKSVAAKGGKPAAAAATTGFSPKADTTARAEHVKADTAARAEDVKAEHVMPLNSRGFPHQPYLPGVSHSMAGTSSMQPASAPLPPKQLRIRPPESCAEAAYDASSHGPAAESDINGCSRGVKQPSDPASPTPLQSPASMPPEASDRPGAGGNILLGNTAPDSAFPATAARVSSLPPSGSHAAGALTTHAVDGDPYA